MRLLISILLALVLVPAALAAGPRGQAITGTISANSGSSITVTSGDRSVTCAVRGEKAQAALARWGVGAAASMACRRDGARLLLIRLSRLGATEGGTTPPAATTNHDGTNHEGTNHDGTTTAPAPPPPPTQTRHDEPPHPTTTTATTTTAPGPVPPPAIGLDRRDARGVVTALSSDGVTVRPDASGDQLRCRITPAADSTAAAAALSLGAHVSIACRRDGSSYVLSSATPVG